MTRRSVPDRIRRALSCLPVTGSERVLEIGCGVGTAAAALLAGHPGLRYVAVDRSPTAVAATSRRTAQYVDEGRCRVIRADLSALPSALLPKAQFDLAFALNVNLFWTTLADAESDLLAGYLRPAGVLVLLYELPDAARLPDVSDRVLRSMAAGGLAASADVAAGHLVISAERMQRGRSEQRSER